MSPPPASMARASPRRMISAAVPIASVPAAQAVQVAVTGPRRPSSIDTWPAPMFATLWGIANGDTRSMPRSSITRCCSSREIVPEPPLPMIAPIPAPSWSIGRPESCSARRAGGHGELGVAVHAPGGAALDEVGGVEAVRLARDPHGQSLASKSVIIPAPDLPATADAHISSRPMPRGQTTPMPVIATRMRPLPFTRPPSRRRRARRCGRRSRTSWRAPARTGASRASPSTWLTPAQASSSSSTLIVGGTLPLPDRQRASGRPRSRPRRPCRGRASTWWTTPSRRGRARRPTSCRIAPTSTGSPAGVEVPWAFT